MAGSKDNYYDYVVIGCGGIGSAVLYWLAKRTRNVEARVLGLEQYKLGHDNGGSQDVSRIIRLAYYVDAYADLAKGAYEAWEEVERESGEQIIFKTGGLNIGRKGTATEKILRLYVDSMRKRGIPYEVLEGDDLRQRFPQFTGANLVAGYQKDSGLVDAARGNSIHIQLAQAHGATILENAAVARISRQEDGTMKVYSSKGIFTCRRIIVTSGAWTNNVLRPLGLQLPLIVTQEQVTFFRTPHVKECGKSRCPVFMYLHPKFSIYGIPSHGNTFPKIAVDIGMSPTVTAESRTFIPDAKREKFCVDFLKETLPKFLGPIAYTKTCLYTLTPDRHFVVDTCAEVNYSEVIVYVGSGHGYKFASILGKILTDLAVDGATSYNIAPFRLGRPAIMDPTYKPNLHFRPEKTRAIQSKL